MTYCVLPDAGGASLAASFACGECVGSVEHPGCMCLDEASSFMTASVRRWGGSWRLVRHGEGIKYQTAYQTAAVCFPRVRWAS